MNTTPNAWLMQLLLLLLNAVAARSLRAHHIMLQ
jgi:hypothetical protein